MKPLAPRIRSCDLLRPLAEDPLVEPLPDHHVFLRDTTPNNSLRPVRFEPFALYPPVVQNGRIYNDQRYELVFGWVECKGNGDFCQAERTPSLRIPVDTAGEFR